MCIPMHLMQNLKQNCRKLQEINFKRPWLYLTENNLDLTQQETSRLLQKRGVKWHYCQKEKWNLQTKLAGPHSNKKLGTLKLCEPKKMTDISLKCCLYVWRVVQSVQHGHTWTAEYRTNCYGSAIWEETTRSQFGWTTQRQSHLYQQRGGRRRRMWRRRRVKRDEDTD